MPHVLLASRRFPTSPSSIISRLLFVLFALLSVAASAQSIGNTVNGETATPTPGAGHNYIHLLSETVDPASG